MMAKTHPVDALIEAFPRLFRGQAPEGPSPLPHGWHPLVHALFVDLDALLTDVEADTFEVAMIRDEFGELRVYFELGSEATLDGKIISIDPPKVQRINIHPEPASPTFQKIRARIARAEEESLSICSECGGGGGSIDESMGWLVTLCADCRAAWARAIYWR